MSFSPPFCPNPQCSYHAPENSTKSWWRPAGFFPSHHSGKVPRFQCLSCSRTCSRSTFQVEFRAKYRLDLKRIAFSINSGEGLRSLSRALGVRENSISNRLSRLSRQALSLSAKLRSAFSLQEDLVADGIESFTWSPYFPNNFTVLLGKRTQYFYGVDYSLFPRKGKMTRKQKVRQSDYDKTANIPQGSLSQSFQRILFIQNDLWIKSLKKELILYTDDHKTYQRLIARNPFLRQKEVQKCFVHHQTSSKQIKDWENPLMGVNYFTREVRKDQANHCGQALQGSKDANASMERMWLYGVMHNCFRAYPIQGAKVDLGKCQTQAQMAGVPTKVLKKARKEFFEQRVFYSKEAKFLNESEWRTWMKTWPNPLSTKAPVLWPFMVA